MVCGLDSGIDATEAQPKRLQDTYCIGSFSVYTYRSISQENMRFHKKQEIAISKSTTM